MSDQDQKDIDATKAPLMEHLIELRRRLIWSLGAIVTFILLRQLQRMSSGCWIIHDGGVRIERPSWNGETVVETIGGDDVEAIDLESAPKDGLHVIAIRLRTGKKIRSPTLAGKDQTLAVQAEIIRRLGLNSRGAR